MFDTTMRGKIRNIVDGKGFAFVLGEDGQDRFVHQSAMRNRDFTALRIGSQVEFIPVKGPKGLRAEDVIIVG